MLHHPASSACLTPPHPSLHTRGRRMVAGNTSRREEAAPAADRGRAQARMGRYGNQRLLHLVLDAIYRPARVDLRLL